MGWLEGTVLIIYDLLWIASRILPRDSSPFRLPSVATAVAASMSFALSFVFIFIFLSMPCLFIPRQRGSSLPELYYIAKLAVL